MPTKSQAINAERLKSLAFAGVNSLKDYPAELALIQAVARGEDARIGSIPPQFMQIARADERVKRLGREHEVRAEMIRWLCVDPIASALVDPLGIRMYGALISGALNLSHLQIRFPIVMNYCRISEPANLDGLQILALDLQGSWTGPLTIQWARIQQALFLDRGFRAEGGVRLYGSHVGSLECEGGTFINANKWAIYADSLTVDGMVLLRAHSKSEPFLARGSVRLLGASIGGDVDCQGATFINPGGIALGLARATVKGALLLRGGREEDKHDGRVVVGGFKAEGVIDLRGTSAGILDDDVLGWPNAGDLKLDGFVYARFNPASPSDPQSRLSWLSRDRTLNIVQPYQQLAKLLKDSGNTRGAKEVLSQMESRLSKANDPPAVQLLRASIGYGYQPENAVWGLLGLTAVGALLSWRSQRMGNIVLLAEDSSNDGAASQGFKPHEHRSNPIIFSLENTFPLVKLGEADKWGPTSQEAASGKGNLASRISSRMVSGRFMRWFIWIQILLGWLLATLFVAGVLGIVQKS